MSKISVEDINIKEEEYILRKSSDIWKVYQGKDTFYKKFVGKQDSQETLKKLETLLANEDKGLCKIKNLTFQDQSFTIFDGYVIEEVFGKEYKQLRMDELSLNELVIIFSDLYMKVKSQEMLNNYVFPDLATGDNIIYNPETKQNTLIDLDGIQVPGFAPTVVSSNIDVSYISEPLLRRLHLIKDKKGNVEVTLLYKNKFYDQKEKRYKPIVNDLSLFVLFYIMTTGRNFMQLEAIDCGNMITNIHTELLRAGLTEQDILYNSIADLVQPEKEYKDTFLDSLYQLRKKYELKPALSINKKVKQRKFVSKI